MSGEWVVGGEWWPIYAPGPTLVMIRSGFIGISIEKVGFRT